MDTRKIVGWNLRRLRVAQNLSQEQLALEAMIDRAYVGRIERGIENVTLATLDSLIHVLDVPIVELFKEPKNPTLTPKLRAGRKPKQSR